MNFNIKQISLILALALSYLNLNARIESKDFISNSPIFEFVELVAQTAKINGSGQLYDSEIKEQATINGKFLSIGCKFKDLLIDTSKFRVSQNSLDKTNEQVSESFIIVRKIKDSETEEIIEDDSIDIALIESNVSNDANFIADSIFIVDSNLKNIIINAKDTNNHPTIVFQNCIIKGDISFSNCFGRVMLDDKSVIKGKVIGGQIEQN